MSAGIKVCGSASHPLLAGFSRGKEPEQQVHSTEEGIERLTNSGRLYLLITPDCLVLNAASEGLEGSWRVTAQVSKVTSNLA